jgi:hypothetical protein
MCVNIILTYINFFFEFSIYLPIRFCQINLRVWHTITYRKRRHSLYKKSSVYKTCSDCNSLKIRGLAELGVTKSVEQFPKHLKTHVHLRKKFCGCYLTINFKEETFPLFFPVTSHKCYLFKCTNYLFNYTNKQCFNKSHSKLQIINRAFLFLHIYIAKISIHIILVFIT